MIKSTGVVREIDNLGRIVLPIELRRSLGIESKDPMEIYVNGNDIILRKFQSSCSICGGSSNLVFFKDKRICKKCIEELSKLD